MTSSTRIIFILPLLVFLGLSGMLALELTQRERDTPRPQASGRTLPAFSIAQLDDPQAPLTSPDMLRGPLILNVFASWCLPCLAEHPNLLALKQATDIPLIGINWKDTKPAVTEWLTTHGNPYDTIGWDPDGIAAVALGISGAPETFIYDGEGSLVFHFPGPIDPMTLETKVMPVIKALE